MYDFGIFEDYEPLNPLSIPDMPMDELIGIGHTSHDDVLNECETRALSYLSSGMGFTPADFW